MFTNESKEIICGYSSVNFKKYEPRAVESKTTNIYQSQKLGRAIYPYHVEKETMY